VFNCVTEFSSHYTPILCLLRSTFGEDGGRSHNQRARSLAGSMWQKQIRAKSGTVGTDGHEAKIYRLAGLQSETITSQSHGKHKAAATTDLDFNFMVVEQRHEKWYDPGLDNHLDLIVTSVGEIRQCPHRVH